MEKFKTKVSSILYNFQTQDRYAGFQSHQKRVVSPYQNKLASGSTAYINASLTDYPEDQLDPTDDFHSADGGPDLSNGEGVKELSLAWNHINTWCSKYQPDLYEALSSPVTSADLIEAQSDLKVTFPECVARSLRIHDGQDNMPGVKGLLFGLELMDLDSIVKMTMMWRKVSDRIHNDQAQKVMMNKIGNMSQPQLSHNNSSNLSHASKMNNLNQQAQDDVQDGSSSQHRQSNHYKTEVPKQGSIPPGAVQPVYANPLWIPLLTDNAGNHIGVDLAPGPKGKWGQVIIFGREFDTKYVVAPTWGDFLLIFANDLELKNWRIEGEEDEDDYGGSGELVFHDRATKRDKVYMSVLVERSYKVYKQQAQKERKNHTVNRKPLPRTPDLIDASSPVVNELEVFPDNNNAIEKTVSADDDEEEDDEAAGVTKDDPQLDEVQL